MKGMTRGEAINYLKDLNIPPEKVQEIIESFATEGKSDFIRGLRTGYTNGYATALERVGFIMRNCLGDQDFRADVNGEEVISVSAIESALRTCGCKEK